MATLSNIHQNIMDFTIYLTRKIFYDIAMDHAHEQEHVHIKGDGGAIDLTENQLH